MTDIEPQVPEPRIPVTGQQQDHTHRSRTGSLTTHHGTRRRRVLIEPATPSTTTPTTSTITAPQKHPTRPVPTHRPGQGRSRSPRTPGGIPHPRLIKHPGRTRRPRRPRHRGAENCACVLTPSPGVPDTAETPHRTVTTHTSVRAGRPVRRASSRSPPSASLTTASQPPPAGHRRLRAPQAPGRRCVSGARCLPLGPSRPPQRSPRGRPARRTGTESRTAR